MKSGFAVFFSKPLCIYTVACDSSSLTVLLMSAGQHECFDQHRDAEALVRH